MRQNALTPLNQDDYASIEAAVMETARGRWFLAEYARRNRNADTEVILGAIGRLEQAMTGERALQDIERVKFDLMEMAKAIARTKVEIASLRPNGESVTHFEEATEALDAIVRTTERATSEILECAEKIQEAAWTLREHSGEYEQCDVLDRRATQIYTACSFQDLTAQRITKVVQTLRYLEGRINAMIDIWGPQTQAEAPMTPQPQREDSVDLQQDDVDLVIDHDIDEAHAAPAFAEPVSEAYPAAAEPLPAMQTPAPEAMDDVVFAGEDMADEEAVAFAGPHGIADTPSATPDAQMIAMNAEIDDQPALHGRSPLDGAVVFQDDADAAAPDPLSELDAMEPIEKLRRFT